MRFRPWPPAPDAVGQPKSTHTLLQVLKPNIYNFDVDVRIVKSPRIPRASSLYCPAIQVNFDQHAEWVHGGVQLVNGKKEISVR